MRSTLIDNLRDVALLVFGGKLSTFHVKTDRSLIPECVSRISWDNKHSICDVLPLFVFDKKIQALSSPAGHEYEGFQSECIFLVVKGVLLGKSSLTDKAMGPPTYAAKWGLKSIENFPVNVIGVFVVLIIFILSPEHEFSTKKAARTKLRIKGGSLVDLEWCRLLEMILRQLYLIKTKRPEEYIKVNQIFQRVVYGDDGDATSDAGEDFGDLDPYDMDMMPDSDIEAPAASPKTPIWQMHTSSLPDQEHLPIPVPEPQTLPPLPRMRELQTPAPLTPFSPDMDTPGALLLNASLRMAALLPALALPAAVACSSDASAPTTAKNKGCKPRKKTRKPVSMTTPALDLPPPYKASKS
ncbi:hypothetical protein H0H92_003345 [Tricholoma furcatifolium]|nr:hypothetical protein H0H92_003345 [Tricholoma furcatifolium]